MNKKLKIRKFVMPTIYGMLVVMFSIAVFLSFKSLSDINEQQVEDINYVSENIVTNDVPVVSTEKVIIKPFKNDSESSFTTVIFRPKTAKLCSAKSHSSFWFST